MRRVFASCVMGGIVAATATSALAEQLYYQAFDYTLGANLSDQNQWVAQGFGNFSLAADPIAAGLTMDGVTTTGNAVDIFEKADLNFLSFTVPDDFYISTLIQKTNDSGYLHVMFREGWNQSEITSIGMVDDGKIFTGNGSYAFSSNSWSVTDSRVVDNGVTTMLVAHINQTAQTVSLWNVPSVGVASLGDPLLTYTYSNTAAIGAVVVGSSWGASGLIDEIKIGTTLEDVVTFVPPSLVGDTNNDGVVDISDYNNVINNFGLTTGGDTNNDGIVDVSDYNNVINNFGASAATALVPEPASMGLLAIGALGLLRRRR